MRQKIAIIGSTGSIGKSTLKIINQNKKLFEVVLLTTNTNLKVIQKQARKFKVKNIIIKDNLSFNKIKNKKISKSINIYNNFSCFEKIFKKKKIDYVMSSISGLNGLEPTLKVIKYTKIIAIANKESIICGWNLINNYLKKYNTKFIPVDSEHFSIWSLVDKNELSNVDKIYITASGGPFLKTSKSKLRSIRPIDAIKHPTWNMGKKISVDSSNLMNKVFEIIEASRIFNLKLNKFNVIIHPKSYLHSIVKFNNGTAKLLIHDTNMEIPIFNSIFKNQTKDYKKNSINFSYLNNLDLKNPNRNKFKNLKILKSIPDNISLFETVLVSANDELVWLFLNNKIKYMEIHKYLIKILNMPKYKKYKKIKPRNVNDITKLNASIKHFIGQIFKY